MNLPANNELNFGSGLSDVREAVILPMAFYSGCEVIVGTKSIRKAKAAED